MKVALLCRKFDSGCMNGFERYAEELYNGLKSRDLELLPFNQNPALPIRSYGPILSPIYYEILAPELRLIRNKGEADIYHAVTETQGVVFPLVHGKKVLTFHHMVGKNPPGTTGERLFNVYWDIAARTAVNQADHLICISSQTKSELIEGWDVDPQSITVVNHGVAGLFHAMGRSGPTGRLGFVGTLNSRKNVGAAIRVLRMILDDDPKLLCTLVICGSGPERQRLEQLVFELGLGKMVEFVDKMSDEQLQLFYNSLDVLIYPSKQEGFGLPILEAQKCGTPVVTLKEATIPEEVVRESIRCKGIEEMASVISKLLKDSQTWNVVSQASRWHADTFTWDRMISETISVYEKILEI